MIQSLCLWNHVFSGFQEKASVIDDGYGGFVSSNIEVPIKKAARNEVHFISGQPFF